MNTKFDPVAFTISYEEGDLNEEQIVDGFQHLVDDGSIWQLQGHYGRAAAAMIAAGLIEGRKW